MVTTLCNYSFKNCLQRYWVNAIIVVAIEILSKLIN